MCRKSNAMLLEEYPVLTEKASRFLVSINEVISGTLNFKRFSEW